MRRLGRDAVEIAVSFGLICVGAAAHRLAPIAPWWVLALLILATMVLYWFAEELDGAGASEHFHVKLRR